MHSGAGRGAHGARRSVPKHFETVLARPDGTEVHVEMSTTAVQRADGLRTLTLIRDIGERRRRQEELERLALHDALTGLPNRRLLIDRLGQIAARAEREPVAAAVFFLDLDGFKNVNDEHGHDAGDSMLVALADGLRDGPRGQDSAARLGGDESSSSASGSPTRTERNGSRSD